MTWLWGSDMNHFLAIIILIIIIILLWSKSKFKSIGKRLGWFIILFVISFSIAQEDNEINLIEDNELGDEQPLVFPDALQAANQKLYNIGQIAADQDAWERSIQAFLYDNGSIDMYNLNLFNVTNTTLYNCTPLDCYNNKTIFIA